MRDPLTEESLRELAERYFKMIKNWGSRSVEKKFWPSGGNDPDAPEDNLRHAVARHFETYGFTPAFEVSSILPKGRRRHRGRIDLALVGTQQLILCEVKLLYGEDFFKDLVRDGDRLNRCKRSNEGALLLKEYGLHKKGFRCLVVGGLWTSEKNTKMKEPERERNGYRLELISDWMKQNRSMKFFRGRNAIPHQFDEDFEYPDSKGRPRISTAHVLTASWMPGRKH